MRFNTRVFGMLKKIGLIAVIALFFAAFTLYTPGTFNSQLVILGYPVVSIAQVGAEGWLAFGQVAGGALVIGQGGYGLVTFAQGGVGVLFGVGQLMFGLVVPAAQLGIGMFYFTGQVGFGLQARGQGVAMRKTTEYFTELHDEIEDMLR